MVDSFADYEWSLVPGPKVLPKPTFPSDRVDQDPLEYGPNQIAQLLASLPGISAPPGTHKDWWHWKATYENHEDIFEINMTLFETEPPLWGGSELVGISYPSTAKSLLELVSGKLPGIYLHSSEALIYTLEGFTERFST